jgi:hypothetical protein
VSAVNGVSVVLPTIFAQGGSWYQGSSISEYDANAAYVVPLWDKGSTAGQAVSSSVPFTWASGNMFSFSGVYEST